MDNRDITPRSVLFIEDHRDTAESVGEYLERRGYAIDHAGDGASGLRLALAGRYDLIALDLGLPDMDGLDLCRSLRRAHTKRTPILVTTGRDTLDEKVEGFDAGADDYLVKPYDIREFEARARALIRRDRQEVSGGVLRVGDLTLDIGTLRVMRAGRELALSPTGIRLLILLMRASPHIVAREAIEHALWGEGVPPSDSLRSHIYSLRRVVDKPFDPPLISTFHHVGYRLAESGARAV